MIAPAVDVVIPTVGRRTLAHLLRALDAAGCAPLGRVIVVDDRPRRDAPLPLGSPTPALGARLDVRTSGARGPAAARNAGWHASRAEWIAFLDDDVLPTPHWTHDLVADLAAAPAGAAGSQGRIHVPLPGDRRATDRERVVRGLETARWASADIAYRRSALETVGGFDERFPRAYREDADLGLRIVARGWPVVTGRRQVVHPPWPAGRWASLAAQAGNADDALMRVLHGPGWRGRAGAPRGRLPRHLAVTAAGVVAALGCALRLPAFARLGALAWLAGTAELAWRRIAPGPRTRPEVADMLLTSVLIPPLAVAHRLRGEWRASRLAVRDGSPARAAAAPLEAVLLDRDGTLIHDVPCNGDPARVRPIAGAAEAVKRLRAAGLRLAVVTNQGAIGEGLVSAAAVDAVNAHIDRTLGPFDAWLVCPHAPAAACGCRKPAPGLVRRALEILRVPPERCAFVGDTGADLVAAAAAGVRGILVPNAVTRHAEVVAAPEAVPTLARAVDRLLAEAP